MPSRTIGSDGNVSRHSDAGPPPIIASRRCAAFSPMARDVATIFGPVWLRFWPRSVCKMRASEPPMRLARRTLSLPLRPALKAKRGDDDAVVATVAFLTATLALRLYG